MRCYEGCNTASYTCHVNQSVSQINVLRWTIVIIGESVILDATHFSTTYIMRGLNHHQSLIINHQWTNNQSTVTQHPYYISIILSTNNNNIALTCASPTLLVIAYVWSRITLSLWQLRISFLSTLAKSSYIASNYSISIVICRICRGNLPPKACRRQIRQKTFRNRRCHFAIVLEMSRHYLALRGFCIMLALLSGKYNAYFFRSGIINDWVAYFLTEWQIWTFE